jgi:GTP cyclohydrolase II
MDKIDIKRIILLENLINKFSKIDESELEILKRVEITGITKEEEKQFKQAVICLYNSNKRFNEILKEIKKE